MKKLLSLVFGAVMVSAVALSTANATSYTGQIEGGDIYTVKNVSKNGVYADFTDATCGETVKFRLKIHNPGPVTLKDVKVAVTLPSQTATSHSSKATVTASNANPASTSDTAGVKLDKAGKLNYVAGSAEYFDPSGNRLGSLSDSIVTTGAEVPGGVGVSTMQKRYVALQAKVSCPEAPKKINVCELSTKKIITIYEKDFDASKHSKNLADCAEEGEIVVCDYTTKTVVTIKESEFDEAKHTEDLSKCEETPVTPPELPRTGSEGLVAVVAALLTAGVAYAVTARRNVLG